MDLTNLQKLTVGDIAAYEDWRREERKKELIALTRELYGTAIPPDALRQIEMELKKIPSILEDGGFDMRAAQYLFWLSLKKRDKDLTLAQVGDSLTTDKLEQYAEMLFPSGLNEKKNSERNRAKHQRAIRT